MDRDLNLHREIIKTTDDLVRWTRSGDKNCICREGTRSMERTSGDPAFPIWLIGDSNPPQWEAHLKTPLDSRHPIRHNIWTSVLEVVQGNVFAHSGRRLNTKDMYVRNSVESPGDKPERNMKEWPTKAMAEVTILTRLLVAHKPIVVISLGSFAFEFACRAKGTPEVHNYGYWDTERLGVAFRESIKTFEPSKTNTMPLLHRSIAGGSFLAGHANFTKGSSQRNYFEFVGIAIGELLTTHLLGREIWVRSPIIRQ
jgi:hypothetical protein